MSWFYLYFVTVFIHKIIVKFDYGNTQFVIVGVFLAPFQLYFWQNGGFHVISHEMFNGFSSYLVHMDIIMKFRSS